MIRGLVMMWRRSRRRHAREHIMGVAVAIGFGAPEPSGAICWGFTA